MNWLKKMLGLGKPATGSPGAPPEPAAASRPLPAPAADAEPPPGTPWQRLLAAIRANDFGTMRELVSDDLGLLRETDDEGATALHHAALAGHVDIVRFLLECDANAEVRDDRGARPIDWANEVGHSPVVRLLFGLGTSANLHESAAYGLVERVRTILEEESPGVNEAAGYGTPLHYAILWGQPEIADLLLDAGADLSATNTHGRNAAAIAAHQLETRGGYTPILVGSRRSELAAGWARCMELLAERAARG